MAFELPDADFAGQLGGGGRVALQGEGTVQGLPVTAPHAGERDFLQRRWGDMADVCADPAGPSREQERLTSNNYEDDEDGDCSRDNCLGDFRGIVAAIMVQHMPSSTKVINVNSS